MARGFLVGAAVAIGAVMLIPGAGAALARAGRPLVRAAMKTGTTAYEEFRRAGAEAYEHFEDLAAEVKAETRARAEREREAAEPAAAAAAAAAAGFTGAAADVEDDGVHGAAPAAAGQEDRATPNGGGEAGPPHPAGPSGG